LVVGDRVDVSTFSGARGERVARWVNANAVYGWGIVTAVGEGAVEVRPMMDAPDVRRSIGVLPSTVVAHAGGEEPYRPDLLSPDDMIHYTACAETPDYDARSVMGIHLTVIYDYVEDSYA
jgi:hypothetical protein